MNLVSTQAGKRAAATTVDCLLLCLPYVAALTDDVPEPARVAAAGAVFVLLAVQAWLLARRGQTIGKIIWKHRVVRRRTGEHPGFLIAVVLRPFVAWAPNLLCLYFRALPIWVIADALVMNWRDDRLSLHDLICGTRVVDEAEAAS